MSVSTFQQTNHQNQTVSTYAQSIDADIAVMARFGDSFAPHEQATPDMSVALDAGHIFNEPQLMEIAAQNVGPFTAPSNEPRIDRIVIHKLTGVASIIVGEEDAVPAAPALSQGSMPVAQILLQPASTVITNDIITDERVMAGQSASSELSVSSVVDEDHLYTVAELGTVVKRSNSGAAMADLLPGSTSGIMPLGWNVTIVNSDEQALMSIGVESGAVIENAPLGFVLLGPGQQAKIVSDGSNYTVANTPDRVRLGADTAIYVSTTGDNANTALTTNMPLLTVQAAVDIVAKYYDLNGFTLTIQLADGTYTDTFHVYTPWVGGATENVIINGNETTPSNVYLYSQIIGVIAYAQGAGAGFAIRNCGMRSTNSICISAAHGASIWFKNIIFGASTNAHIYAMYGARIITQGGYTISGGARFHITIDINSSFITSVSTPVILLNTPAISENFINLRGCAVAHTQNFSFSGGATGTRYYAASNSSIITGGKGTSYFPGSIAGSLSGYSTYT